MSRIEEGILPEDLKNMSYEELESLCDELRETVVNTVSENGGHLASNLGIVELTVALHRVFKAPEDKIVWDVGHQSYVHKLLTGRGANFNSLRRRNGVSGFPKRSESIYDTYDSGHSSDSISAALGMAVARDLNNDSNAVIAVIGDGAMTGGMAFEAMNNAGVMNTPFIVILNDNAMSISKNHGGVSQHLSKLRYSDRYKSFKSGLKKGLTKIPLLGNGIYNGLAAMKDSVKYMVVPGILFEEMGFKYLGPVDGHNLKELIDVFESAGNFGGPVIVHCITQKGRGYKLSENNPDRYHGVGPFDAETGMQLKEKDEKTYSDIFGRKLAAMASGDQRIIAISAAMIDGTGLSGFARTFPDRIFDVGIAEEHAVSFAAGLALSGKRPFVAIYSTFLQRAYDQILIDVCMQNLPVVFCIDRAGIVGEDGSTHHGVFDLSYLMHMPNMTILAPSDAYELRMMMDYALSLNSPVSIRYPKGVAPILSDEFTPRDYSMEPRIMREGSDVTVLAVGKMTSVCLRAAEILEKNGISAEIIDVRQIKPIKGDVIIESARKTQKLVTVEDNVVTGGFGSAIEEFAEQFGFGVTIKKIGWKDEFIPHGSQSQLQEEYGMDSKGIAKRIARTVPEKLTAAKKNEESESNSEKDGEKAVENNSKSENENSDVEALKSENPNIKPGKSSRFRNRMFRRR